MRHKTDHEVNECCVWDLRASAHTAGVRVWGPTLWRDAHGRVAVHIAGSPYGAQAGGVQGLANDAVVEALADGWWVVRVVHGLIEGLAQRLVAHVEQVGRAMGVWGVVARTRVPDGPHIMWLGALVMLVSDNTNIIVAWNTTPKKILEPELLWCRSLMAPIHPTKCISAQWQWQTQ